MRPTPLMKCTCATEQSSDSQCRARFPWYRCLGCLRLRQAAWEQRRRERARRAAIRETFHAELRAIRGEPHFTEQDRKAALRKIRITRIAQEASLRKAIAAERHALKITLRQHGIRRFNDFLTGPMQADDEPLLVLPHKQRPTHAFDPTAPSLRAAIRSVRPVEPSTIVHCVPSNKLTLAHAMQRNATATSPTCKITWRYLSTTGPLCGCCKLTKM